SGGGGHRRGRFAIAGDVALLDSRALRDPLVCGLDSNLRKIEVGHHGLGQPPACTHDRRDRALHAASPSPATDCRPQPMCSFMWDSTARTAARIAFLMARGDDFPCEIMLTPRTPRSGAPPCSE